MGKIYGYVRISTKKQNMDRQIRNIQKEYPEAVIIKEVYTGTKFQGRKELNKLIKQLIDLAANQSSKQCFNLLSDKASVWLTDRQVKRLIKK